MRLNRLGLSAMLALATPAARHWPPLLRSPAPMRTLRYSIALCALDGQARGCRPSVGAFRRARRSGGLGCWMGPSQVVRR